MHSLIGCCIGGHFFVVFYMPVRQFASVGGLQEMLNCCVVFVSCKVTLYTNFVLFRNRKWKMKSFTNLIYLDGNSVAW